MYRKNVEDKYRNKEHAQYRKVTNIEDVNATMLITVNINGLNAPVKRMTRHSRSGNITQLYVVYEKLTLNVTHIWTKSKWKEKNIL